MDAFTQPGAFAHLRIPILVATAANEQLVDNRSHQAVTDLLAAVEQGVEGAVIAGVLAPAGTPRNVVERLNTELAKASEAPRVREIYATNAAEALTISPAELQSALERDTKIWADVVKATGVKLQ